MRDLLDDLGIVTRSYRTELSRAELELVLTYLQELPYDTVVAKLCATIEEIIHNN
jgi:hypothetical protein